MAPRTIAIGDIHGCNLALHALLDAIRPTAQDTIVTLGDYIDRGKNSRDVLERLLTLQNQCQLLPLLGNHEVMLLAVVDQDAEPTLWTRFGGQETLDSYGGQLSAMPQSHLDFIRGCRLFAELDDCFYVHANYAADLPLDQQPESMLLWKHLTTQLPGQHCSGKRAIVGHTPQRSGKVLILDQLICIDTYCYGGGWLTALDVASQVIWQANRQGQLR